MTPVVVLVTTPDAETAARIARALVEERLAACGNVVPGIRSIYRWEQEIHDDAEALLILKSHAEHFEQLRARVVELHPYDVPEVLQIGVDAGSAPYLAWLAAAVTRD